MYTPAAEQLRRCSHPGCRAWAVWGSPDQRCRSHGGRRPDGAKPPRCTCPAYGWPHRPGSGFCRWPDPPERTSGTVAGRHGPRDRSRVGLELKGRVKALRVPAALRDALGRRRAARLNPSRSATR